jgi:hypothetical protein
LSESADPRWKGLDLSLRAGSAYCCFVPDRSWAGPKQAGPRAVGPTHLAIYSLPHSRPSLSHLPYLHRSHPTKPELDSVCSHHFIVHVRCVPLAARPEPFFENHASSPRPPLFAYRAPLPCFVVAPGLSALCVSHARRIPSVSSPHNRRSSSIYHQEQTPLPQPHLSSIPSPFSSNTLHFHRQVIPEPAHLPCMHAPTPQTVVSFTPQETTVTTKDFNG